MNSKKITILCSSDLYYDQRIIRIINSMIHAGYEVYCLSRKISAKIISIKLCNNEQISTFFKKSWLFYAEYNIRIFMKLLFCKTDIIYAVDADTLLVAGIIKKIKNLFLVYDAHEFFEESPEIINKKWIQKIWHLITQFGVNNSHLCISVGEQISHLLSTQFGKQFHTIRNLPDQVMESNSSLTREKIIWYQGVLNIGRGLEEMIECMPFLPDYKFLLAGDGDITQLLKNKVKDLNLEDRILFLGKLNKEELISNNRKAYIGINLLSSDSKNYYYSLANRTFDYIYATLPSIHMNFPEYNSLINKYEFGILLESLNKSEIISAIQKLEEPAFYEHCLEQCKKAAMQNSWKLESEKLIQLINVMHKS